jgi:hypothetical protein
MRILTWVCPVKGGKSAPGDIGKKTFIMVEREPKAVYKECAADSRYASFGAL